MTYNDFPYHTPKRQRIVELPSAASISDEDYSINNNSDIDCDCDILLTPTNCYERPFSLSSFPQAPRKPSKNMFLVSDNEDDEKLIFRTKKLPCLPLMDDVSANSYCNGVNDPVNLSLRRSPKASSILAEERAGTEDEFDYDGDVSSVWDYCFSPTCVSEMPTIEPPVLKRKISMQRSTLSLHTAITSSEDEFDAGIYLLLDKRDVSLLQLPSLSSTSIDIEEEIISKPRLLSMRPRAISDEE